MRRAMLSCLSLLALVGSAPVSAQGLTTVRVANGLSSPLLVTAPANDPRLFIVEKAGRIKILKDGAVLPAPFLDITSLISGLGERGLLGLAFHPDYATNRTFFVSYTDNSGTSTIARYTAELAGPDLADPASAEIVLTQGQPASNHNGGMIAFGPDGYLYIGFGDGGGGGDSSCNAQNPQTFLGKMLRLDVDSGSPYAIPPTNPFVGNPGVLDEIWFLGLRNPWRWSFDRQTGDIYIGDVGQGQREEVSFALAGASGLNFGWKIMEGFGCFGTGACVAPPPCNDPSLELPIRQRTHAQGWSSLTGGVNYRGSVIPGLDGTYFYANYGSTKIFSFEYDPGTGVLANEIDRLAELQPAGASIGSVASFGEDGFGEMYICDLGGEVFKVIPAGGFAADCDGDFHEDAIEIAANADLDLDGNGELDTCQTFSANTGSVSAAATGAQEWSLHAGAAQADRLYLIAGSLSGTSPGFQAPQGNVPLNPDPYLTQTVVMPNQPPLVHSFGRLDADGEAKAAFHLEGLALPPGLIGQSAHHAYATFGSGGIVSNFVEVRFLP